MTGSWLSVCRQLLASSLSKQLQHSTTSKLFSRFKHVWLQDSTSLLLPDAMKNLYPGNHTRGGQTSGAKINVVIDLLTGLCPILNILPYTVCEQALAEDILDIAKEGDLVIRDLGYFVINNLKRIHEAGIFILSRCRYGVKLYDKRTGKEIVLLKKLKGRTWLDQEVLMGREQKVPMRLVAIKLNESVTAERIRKAKTDRDKRLNHSADYYVLLGYVIFLTTVDRQTWTYKEVAQAYRLRWQIEILFKTWKSGFKIEDIIPEAQTRTERVESILYLLMFYLSMFNTYIWQPLKWAVLKKTGKHLSLLKTAKYFNMRTAEWSKERLEWKDMKLIAYYCCYDTRTDRINACQRLELFFDVLA
jgi:hypothetical protein